MKLVEILKQELPERGGWPGGVEYITQGSSGVCYANGFMCLNNILFRLPLCDDPFNDCVYIEQYLLDDQQ